MKKYILEVIINEQSDEWFEMITENGNTGCDYVIEEVKNKLQLFDCEVKLVKFIDDSSDYIKP